MTSLSVFQRNLHNIPFEARGYMDIVNHLNCEYEPVGERDNGDPNPYHVRDVMRQIIEIYLDCGQEIDWVTVCAGGCHDLKENTYGKRKKVTHKIIAKAFGLVDVNFGESVAQIVDNVSKLPRTMFPNKEERLAEYHSRFIASSYEDYRGILVKYPDRGHNVATLHGLVRTDPSKVRRIAEETLDFYVPKGQTEALEILPTYFHVKFTELVDRMEMIALGYMPRSYVINYCKTHF